MIYYRYITLQARKSQLTRLIKNKMVIFEPDINKEGIIMNLCKK